MKTILYLFVAVVSMAFWSGCRESSVIGDDFIEGADYELALNNTFPLGFSTVQFDSLITSRSARLLIGGQEGTPYGNVDMASYFLFTLANSDADEYVEAEDFERTLRYDSITLTIPMDGYSLYLDENTVTETIVVEQLPVELKYPDDEEALYNFSTPDGLEGRSGLVLGEQTFFFSDDRVRDLEIRLTDRLGAALFSRLEDGDEIFLDQEQANEYLLGFRLSIVDNPFILGIKKDSLRLTLHTTDITTSTSSNRKFDFFIAGAPAYSRFTHSQVPEILQVEDLDDEIPSNQLADQAYIIGGLGYAAKIDLTEIRQILLDGESFIIPRAELRVRWLEQSHDTYPEILAAILIDEDFNDLTEGQTFALNREVDEEYGRNNFYTMDATSIINYIIDEPFGGQYYLLLTLDNLATTPTPVLLGDQSYESELNIYTIKNK